MKNFLQREKRKEAKRRCAPVTPEEIAIAEAIEDPVLFASAMLGINLWPIQAAIAHSVRDNDRTVVKACHSSGKTLLAAVLALWWLAAFEDGIVVTTAPTDLQVKTLLWGEITKLISTSVYPFPVPHQKEIRFPNHPGRFGLGFATSVTQNNQGVRFQGFHGHILIILDEAPGVHPAIWEAIRGIRAGGTVHVLALGNPTINSGPFFDSFGKDRANINTYTISAFDTPNLMGLDINALKKMAKERPDLLAKNKRPYLTTRGWVLECFEELGPEHPSYQSRVLGQFPKQSDSSLLSLAWLEMAKLRDWRAKEHNNVVVGIDVAGPGEDETVLAARDGCDFLGIDAYPDADPRGKVVARLLEWGPRLKVVNIDSVGIGEGLYRHVADIFEPKGVEVNPVNVGEATEDPEKYTGLKAELYWGLRQRLKDDDFCCNGEFDDRAISQLAGLRYGQNPRGQTFIEKKEDARKRGTKSPDRAEAIMLAFAKSLKPGDSLRAFMAQQISELTKPKGR